MFRYSILLDQNTLENLQQETSRFVHRNHLKNLKFDVDRGKTFEEIVFPSFQVVSKLGKNF